MQVDHGVSNRDKEPEHLADAFARRQAAEDVETIKVRGPQRPADQPGGLQQPVKP